MHILQSYVSCVSQHKMMTMTNAKMDMHVYITAKILIRDGNRTKLEQN